MSLHKIIKSLKFYFSVTSKKRYEKYLKKCGVKIGVGCEFYGLPDITIDTTRPSLVEIGNNVIFTKGVIILTHGYDWAVIREKYGDFLGYAQPVKIKDNVFLGMRTIVLPGVVIAENCIIAAGSVVTKSTEADSIYAGIPAKRIMGIEEYYYKRKKAQVEEAINYGRSIVSNLNRNPEPTDFREFFQLFLERDEDKFLGIPVKMQTKTKFNEFMQSEPTFASFDDFLTEVLRKDNNKE